MSTGQSAVNFVVEKAGPDDAEDMAKLHYLSHTKSFATFASKEFVQSRKLETYQRQWKAALDENVPRASAWVARINAQVAGMVRVTPLNTDTAQLISMHVHPDLQGNGIGRALMTEAMKFIWQAGYRRAELGVIQANTRARRLYESAGWKVKELRDNGVEGVPVAVYEWWPEQTG